MRIHRNHFFGLAAVLVGTLALGSGCVVEDDDGSMADHPDGGSSSADHPEGGSSSSETGGAAGSSDDGVGGTSDSGGEGGAAPTAGSAGTTQGTGGDGGVAETGGSAGATQAAGGEAGAAETGGSAGATQAAGGEGGAEETGGSAGTTQASGGGGAGGAAGGTATAGAGGEAGAAPCFGDNANGGFDCNALPGDDVTCPDGGGAGAGGAGGATGGLPLYGIDLCLSLASDGRPGVAEAFYNCVNEISPAECSTAYDNAVVECQNSVTTQACESTAATEACGRINCAGCSDILIIWSDAVIADIESCYMDLRTDDPSGDCLDQLKDAEAGIGCS
jgi:hypothetical protein